jgi:hypothetical protein
MGKNGTVSILAWKFYIGKFCSIQECNCASSFYTWELDFSFGTVYLNGSGEEVFLSLVLS